MGKVDTSSCCGGGKGKGPHLDGCPMAQPGAASRAKGWDRYEAAKNQAAEGALRKARAYADKNKNNRFRTRLAPGGGHGGMTLPPGVRMVEDKSYRAEKVYKIVVSCPSACPARNCGRLCEHSDGEGHRGGHADGTHNW